MSKCKNCLGPNNNGTNFCTRKCRKEWVKDHKIKGGKKKARRRQEEFEMTLGSDFSNEDDYQDSY